MKEKSMPTLIVGLGGIGCKIANAAGKMLGEMKTDSIGIVGIDTNIEDLKNCGFIKGIWIGQGTSAKELIKDSPEMKKWFPENKYAMNRSISEGAGQVRSISRLAFLSAIKQMDGHLFLLDSEIERVLRESKAKEIAVFITGSLAGGTAGGMFLQIPFYIRQYIQKNFADVRVFIRGIFAGTDFLAKLQPSKINDESVKVNTYASLKELNAFYLAQEQEEIKNKIKLEFYNVDNKKEKSQNELEEDFIQIKRDDDFQRLTSDYHNNDSIPYDSFYLIEEQKMLFTSVEEVIQKLANIVLTICLIEKHRISSPDIIGRYDDAQFCKNHFASAGIYELCYPYEQILEYVGLGVQQKEISEEWLFLDEMFTKERKVALDKQRKDPCYHIPAIEEWYPFWYEKEEKMFPLHGEAFCFSEGESKSKISKAEIYIQKINNVLHKTIQKHLAEINIERYAVQLNRMDSKTEVFDEVDRVLQGMEESFKTMEEFIHADSLRMMQEIFPEKTSFMEQDVKNYLGIDQLLSKTHPITTRVLIYKCISLLKEMLFKLKYTQTVRNEIISFGNQRGYSIKKKENVNIREILSIILDKKHMDFLGRDRRALRKIGIQFAEETDVHLNKILDYSEAKLRILVYTNVIEKLKRLAGIYEEFFYCLGVISEDILSKMKELETISQREDIKIVYGSEMIFRNTLIDFLNQNQFKLSDNVKNAILDKLYFYSDKYYDELNLPQKSKTLSNVLFQVYESEIAADIKAFVKEKGNSHIDLSIKEAIFRQEEVKDNNSYEWILSKIFSNIDLDNKIARGDSVKELTCLVMHPDSGISYYSEWGYGTIDKSIILESPKCSRYKIAAIKIRYDLMVDNFLNYREENEYASLYRRRIRDWGREIEEAVVDGYRTRISPHLNVYWHESDMIPELTERERTRVQDDVLKAFFYALGMHMVERKKRDGVNGAVWIYVENHFIIKIHDRLCPSSYYGLYCALKSNRVLVADIINKAQEAGEAFRIKTEKNCSYSDFIKTVFVTKCQSEYEDSGIMNLLDILYHIKATESIKYKDWENMFQGLLVALKDWLMIFWAKDNERLNSYYQEILAQMYQESRCGQKEIKNEPLDDIESGIKKQIDLLKQVHFFG